MNKNYISSILIEKIFLLKNQKHKKIKDTWNFFINNNLIIKLFCNKSSQNLLVNRVLISKLNYLKPMPFMINKRFYNSLQINRFFLSSLRAGQGTRQGVSSNHKVVSLWFVTGLIDAEGCFNIVITKSSSVDIGWRVLLRLIIELDKNDLELLHTINSFFFNTGTITGASKKGIVWFSTS